ncbi:MAG: DNA-directed RNA polymerase subunit delta [Acetobacteraceae bacterium]|nr:DNA-directed RNA polymerase subunit delta [Acetobacteraceae bacterium]
METDRRSAAKVSVPDLAYRILKRAGQPMHYRQLIGEVLDARGVPEERRGRAMAEAHTEINLDPRFQYLGQARWGLREWTEKEPARGEGSEGEAGADGEEEYPEED